MLDAVRNRWARIAIVLASFLEEMIRLLSQKRAMPTALRIVVLKLGLDALSWLLARAYRSII